MYSGYPIRLNNVLVYHFVHFCFVFIFFVFRNGALNIYKSLIDAHFQSEFVAKTGLAKAKTCTHFLYEKKSKNKNKNKRIGVYDRWRSVMQYFFFRRRSFSDGFAHWLSFLLNSFNTKQLKLQKYSLESQVTP